MEKSLTLFLLFAVISYSLATNILYSKLKSRYDNLYLTNVVRSSVPSFVKLNYETINKNTTMESVISNASSIMMSECCTQFKDEMWNCSTAFNSLQKTAKQATRESAFLYSIFAASLAHSLSTACLRGLTNDCKCVKVELTKEEKDAKIKNVPYSKECLGNSLRFGITKSRELLTNKKIRDVRWKMNEHNKETGRMAILQPKLNKLLTCVCHGVSGACAVKKCVKKLPLFEEVAKELKIKYENAIKAGPDNTGKLISYTKVTPSKFDLIFISDSPDFCRQDLSRGVIGVKGRTCSLDKNAINNCETFCCRRGYKKLTFVLTKSCQCKFRYCCRLDCKTCHHNVTEHRCN